MVPTWKISRWSGGHIWAKVIYHHAIALWISSRLNFKSRLDSKEYLRCRISGDVRVPKTSCRSFKNNGLYERQAQQAGISDVTGGLKNLVSEKRVGL